MKHIEIVKHFKDLITCKKFVVTGSLALKYHGFTTRVRDLDIVLVKPAPESVKLLEKLREENPTGKKWYPWDNQISLMFDGVQIDFFMQALEETELMVNGIFIAKVSDIIKAKKSYKRPKDWVQLLRLSRQIVSPGEFNKYIDSGEMGHELAPTTEGPRKIPSIDEPWRKSSKKKK